MPKKILIIVDTQQFNIVEKLNKRFKSAEIPVVFSKHEHDKIHKYVRLGMSVDYQRLNKENSHIIILTDNWTYFNKKYISNVLLLTVFDEDAAEYYIQKVANYIDENLPDHEADSNIEEQPIEEPELELNTKKQPIPVKKSTTQPYLSMNGSSDSDCLSAGCGFLMLLSFAVYYGCCGGQTLPTNKQERPQHSVSTPMIKREKSKEVQRIEKRMAGLEDSAQLFIGDWNRQLSGDTVELSFDKLHLSVVDTNAIEMQVQNKIRLAYRIENYPLGEWRIASTHTNKLAIEQAAIIIVGYIKAFDSISVFNLQLIGETDGTPFKKVAKTYDGYEPINGVFYQNVTETNPKSITLKKGDTFRHNDTLAFLRLYDVGSFFYHHEVTPHTTKRIIKTNDSIGGGFRAVEIQFDIQGKAKLNLDTTTLIK